MVKATKLKASKPPNKTTTPVESSQAGGKRTGRGRRKPAAAIANEAQLPQQIESSDDSHEATENLTLKVPARIVWDKYPERTERLLDYLDARPDVALKLFGDSTQAAKSDGRSKLTAKSNKAAAYLQLAEAIFSIDKDGAVRADFAANPNKYAKAVDNYIANT
jgi:hypothetical protein